MKNGMFSFFQRAWKAMKHPLLCRWNIVESFVPLSETVSPEPPVLIPHHSSGFESISFSSTLDNMSKTSSTLSEDNIDEREGDYSCSMRAKRRPSLHHVSIIKQDMWGQDGISSIPEYMYTLPGEVPVSGPSVTLSAQCDTDASPMENSATEKHTNNEERRFFTRPWMVYLLLCCIQLSDSVNSSLSKL